MQQLCCLLYAITLEKHSRPTYLSNLAVLLEGTNLIGTLAIELFLSTLTSGKLTPAITILHLFLSSTKSMLRFVVHTFIKVSQALITQISLN